MVIEGAIRGLEKGWLTKVCDTGLRVEAGLADKACDTGLEDTMRCLEAGAIEMLMVWENLDTWRLELR